jgi:hypothetical protein
MGGFEFVASVIGSIAWPGAIFGIAVFLAVYFRFEFRRIFSAVSHVRYGDLQIEFRDKLAAVEQELKVEFTKNESVASLPSTGAQPKGAEPRELQREIEAVASISPSAAVQVAWSEVERSLVAAGRRSGIDLGPSKTYSPTRLMEELRARGFISTDLVKFLRDIRSLRNRVAHPGADPFSISVEDALGYANVAVGIMYELDGINAR